MPPGGALVSAARGTASPRGSALTGSGCQTDHRPQGHPLIIEQARAQLKRRDVAVNLDFAVDSEVLLVLRSLAIYLSYRSPCPLGLLPQFVDLAHCLRGYLSIIPLFAH